MTHGTSSNPAKNPHPVARYEVTATVTDAPGPWDSIEGYIGYDIVNTKCMPLAPFLGERGLTSIGVFIKMTRLEDNTWRGYFYRDALQDEDYADLGVCHWDVTSVSVSTTAQEVRFAWSAPFDELLRNGPSTSYFKSSVYGDRSFAPDGAPNYSPLRAEYKQNPSEFFPVTIAVKESAK